MHSSCTSGLGWEVERGRGGLDPHSFLTLASNTGKLSLAKGTAVKLHSVAQAF